MNPKGVGSLNTCRHDVTEAATFIYHCKSLQNLLVCINNSNSTQETTHRHTKLGALLKYPLVAKNILGK
jgi:hypothetical protein